MTSGTGKYKNFTHTNWNPRNAHMWLANRNSQNIVGK